MYKINGESSDFGRLSSMAAVILIFAGFAFIIFSIISFDNIIFLVSGIIPGVILLIAGFLIFSRFIRALKYYNIYMSGAHSLQEISDILMDSKRNIKKDIEKMALLGIMPHARFDAFDNLVFSSDIKDEHVIDVPVEEEIHEEKQVQESSSIKEWQKYLSEISSAENEFKSQDISFSLYRLGKVIRQVLEYLEKHQEKEKDVKKLMDFHLPSTLKLIASYRELQKSGLNTFNIQKTKDDIVSACDKIQEAYTGVLEDLYNDNAIDVSTDIQVLKMMLAREGFLDRDAFKIKK